MEVHPPEHGIHSWRDFFVHMATICLGLLIAISLEQSVEWMHHRHQRHQLELDLCSEGEQNLDHIALDKQFLAALRVWELGLRGDVNAMRTSGGKANLRYKPDPVNLQPISPSNTAWATAKDSQMLALLPAEEAGMYARLNYQHELLQMNMQRWFDAREDLSAFENNFAPAGSTVPDFAAMTTDDLRSYSMQLSKLIAAQDTVVLRLNNFKALDQAILNGARSEQQMLDEAIRETRIERDKQQR